jgi:hypothetical protein
MGILDDAIRQHLELKRSHGATDSELQRMEDEAFGPPSRPGEPDFPEHEGAEAEQSVNGAAHEEPSPEAAPPTVVEAEPEQVSPVAEDHDPAEDQTALYDQTVEPQHEDIASEEHDRAPAEEPAVAEAAEEPEEPPHDAAPEAPIESLDTVEHPMPDEEVGDEAAEEPGEGDDVLADTPEFLKDAPEDDELWFEQGKPKDFDF